MILRNGKALLPPKCYTCKKFFGNSYWDWKCSVCSGNGTAAAVSPFYSDEYQKKLKEYVDSKIADDEMIKLLKWCFEHDIGIGGIIPIVKMFVEKGVFIRAKTGETLLRSCGRYYQQKSDLVCPLIFDWWNMRKFNFTGGEMCYYGRFGDDPKLIIFDFPPPLPNKTFDKYLVSRLYNRMQTPE